MSFCSEMTPLVSPWKCEQESHSQLQQATTTNDSACQYPYVWCMSPQCRFFPPPHLSPFFTIFVPSLPPQYHCFCHRHLTECTKCKNTLFTYWRYYITFYTCIWYYKYNIFTYIYNIKIYIYLYFIYVIYFSSSFCIGR